MFPFHSTCNPTDWLTEFTWIHQSLPLTSYSYLIEKHQHKTQSLKLKTYKSSQCFPNLIPANNLCLWAPKPPFIALLMILKMDPVNVSSLTAGPKLSFGNGRSWRNTAERRGFSSWLQFSFFSSCSCVACPVWKILWCSLSEFQQPLHGPWFPLVPQPASQQGQPWSCPPEKFNTPPGSFPTNSTSTWDQFYVKFYQHPGRWFSACQSQAATCQQTSPTSGLQKPYPLR